MAFVVSDIVVMDGVIYGTAAYFTTSRDPVTTPGMEWGHPEDTEVQPVDRGFIETHIATQLLRDHTPEPLAGLFSHARARAFMRLEARITAGVKFCFNELDATTAGELYLAHVAPIWERIKAERPWVVPGGAVPQTEVSGEPSEIEVGQWI